MAPNEESKPRPLRIVIIDTKERYCRTILCAIALGISHVLFGATVMSILIYSLQNNDSHAVLLSVAYHFFSVEAILSLNYASGWSAPLRLRHRRFAHVFLNICALICGITGTVIITMDKGLSATPHGLNGFITAALACITFLLGPLALFGGRYGRLVHALFGVPTFVMSSVSFCFGLFTSAFRNWAPSAIVFILLGFIVFYTTIITIMWFIRLYAAFKKYEHALLFLCHIS